MHLVVPPDESRRRSIPGMVGLNAWRAFVPTGNENADLEWIDHVLANAGETHALALTFIALHAPCPARIVSDANAIVGLARTLMSPSRAVAALPSVDKAVAA